MALIKCKECGIDLLVDGVEKFESKEVNARVDNCPNCGAWDKVWLILCWMTYH